MRQRIGSRLRRNLVWIYLGMAGMSVLLMFGIQFFLPDRWILVYKEDRLIEYMGALILFATFILGIPLVIKTRHNRVLLLFIALLGLFGMLLEVGFGKRAIDSKINSDGNLIFELIRKTILFLYHHLRGFYDDHRALFYLLLISGAAAIIYLFLRSRIVLNEFLSRGTNTQTFVLAFLFVALIITGQVLDVVNVHRNIVIAIEEIIEVNASLALMFFMFSIYHPK